MVVVVVANLAVTDNRLRVLGNQFLQELHTSITVLRDDTFDVSGIVEALTGCFNVSLVSLKDTFGIGSFNAPLKVICANLGSIDTYQRVTDVLAGCESEAVIILPAHSSSAIPRLRRLKVANHLVLPINPAELLALARGLMNRQVERSWNALHPAKTKALKKSLATFDTCFARVRDGEPLPMDEIEASSRHIRGAAELGGLDSWIKALDDHHNYSYRHSMFVSGTLTYFAHAIGFNSTDIERLALGGLLHDIGKTHVPLEILDKPGKLDDGEWSIMRAHPEHSRTVLLGEQCIDMDIVEMAVHHHEMLDGTGYPDGLTGARISDYMRLMSIADVYSALIDKRAYKGSMSPEAALDLMTKCDAHLDMDLVRVFRDFVLDTAGPGDASGHQSQLVVNES